MFNNLFKGFKKDKNVLESSNERMTDKPISQDIALNLTTENAEAIKEIDLILKQQEISENEEAATQQKEATIVKTATNEKIEREEKSVKKATEQIAEYKLFYRDKFRECRSIYEVLDVYMKYTDNDELLNDLRLKYISMYLFNTSLSNDKLSIADIKLLLKDR